MLEAAGSDAYDCEPMRATATVALRLERLGTISVPPRDARMAAASHTLFTPMWWCTRAEGVGTSSSTRRMSVATEIVHGQLELVGQAGQPRLVGLEVDRGQAGEARPRQAGGLQGPQQELAHLLGSGVAVAPDAGDERAGPQHERARGRGERAVLDPDAGPRRDGAVRDGAGHAPGQETARVVHRDRLPGEQRQVHRFDGRRVFDDEPELEGDDVDRRHPVHVGCGRDDGPGPEDGRDLPGERVRPPEVARHEADRKAAAFVDHDDRRVLGLVDQQAGHQPHHDPGCHHADVAAVGAKALLQRRFQGRERHGGRRQRRERPGDEYLHPRQGGGQPRSQRRPARRQGPDGDLIGGSRA